MFSRVADSENIRPSKMQFSAFSYRKVWNLQDIQENAYFSHEH